MGSCGIKYRGPMKSRVGGRCVEPAGHAGPRDGATPHSDGCGMMWWEDEDFAHMPHVAALLKPKPKRAPSVTAKARRQTCAESVAVARVRVEGRAEGLREAIRILDQHADAVMHRGTPEAVARERRVELLVARDMVERRVDEMAAGGGGGDAKRLRNAGVRRRSG